MKTTEQFITESKLAHPNKYTYEHTEYTGSMSKLTLTCPIHGNFMVTPNAHLSTQKSGCQKCSKRYHYNKQDFIEQVNKIHDNKYDYSNMVYANNKTKIDIICPIHGTFKQLPTTHLCKRGGCKKCANQNAGSYHKHDTDWFIREANKKHNNKYDYSKVHYQRIHDKVEIICPEHGSFLQSAGGHIHQSHGCPTCSYKDYEGGYGSKRFENHPEIKELPGLLYVVRIYNDVENFIKVGITQKTIRERFMVNNMLPYEYEVVGYVPGKLFELFNLEQFTKTSLKKQKYKPLIKFNGHTECFVLEVQKDLLKLVGINSN